MDASKTSSIRNILKLMKSWINNVMINKGDVSSIATFDKKLHNHFVLNNLFYLTIKYSDVYITEIEDLWIALIQKIIPHSNSQIIPESNSTSAAYIIDYLLDVCSRSQNENFLSASKLITIILSRTKSCQCVVDSLLSRIIPSTINSTIQISDSVSTSAALNDYCISLDKIESKKLPLISRGQLALLFLVDLTLEIDINLIKQHLSTLLTAIFVQLDHEFKIISDGCRELLIKLLYSFIPADLAGGEIETITGFIVNQDKFWLDEETSLSNRNNSSNVKLDDFVSQITDLFSLVDTNFPQTWGHKALYWSINCSIRNISSRSLQILRSIVPVFTRQMVDDLLLRLADILANKSLVEQRFSLEILTTLDVMFDSLEQHRVILFPQFFWVGIACLYSQHECEYVYGVKILRKFLDVVDLSDLSTRRMIQNTIPSQFQSIFGGLITLLSRGICSSLCEQNCVYLINKLIKVSDWSFFIGPIIEKKTRNDLFVMYALMVNIPLLMMDLDNNVTSSESCDVAQHLSNLCYSLGYSDLGRIMDSFSKQKFKGKKDIDSLIANSLFVSFKDEMPTLFEFFLSGISSPLPKNKYILKILAQIQKKKPNLVFKTFNFNIIYPLHNSKETMFMEVLAGCIEAEIELSSSCTRPFLQNISFSDLSKATAVKELQSINKTALPFSETGWFQDGSDNSNYCRTLLSNLISCANISIESGNENLKNEFNISFDQLDTMTRIEAIDELDKMIMQYIGKFDQIDTKSLLSEYRSITTSLHETCLVESTHVYANIQNLNSTMTTTERLLFIKESKLYFVLRIKISALNLKDNGIMKVLCEVFFI